MLAVLAGSTAFRESVAVDEVAHIGAGVSYWKLDLRMNPEHPPLVKLLAAAPLVARGVRADYADYIWTWSGLGPFNPMLAEWPFGAAIITHWNDRDATLRWARFPMLLLLLATGLVIYRYGERLSDGWGGAFALCWFATAPTFLTFGPLVLTDTAVALFSLVALWTFATMWRDQSRGATRRVALALALALLSKFSAGLLLFVFAAFPFVLRWLPLAGQPSGVEFRAWWRRGWRLTGKAVLMAALLVYSVEFVLSWNQPTDLLKVIGGGWAAMALRRLLLPLVTYLGGVVLFGFGAVRPTYLFGHAYSHGVWFYFPVVTLLKSTLAFLAALAISLAAALAARFGRPRATAVRAGMEFHWRSLWLGMVIITFACMMSPMTISIRHFSVPLALLSLLLAPVPRLLANLRDTGRTWARAFVWISAALAAASVITVVRAWPFYMPFLNSLALGRPGYELVSDSNLDWDTELPEVERFVQTQGLDHVLVDSYNIADPSVYVPQGRLWDCQAAAAGDAGLWAFVSANMFADGENCAWLLNIPHEPLAGGSMYAFHLPATIPTPGSPGGPPLPANYRYMAGAPFDWRQMLYRTIRDPHQMPETLDAMKAYGAAQQKNRRGSR
ncbi:MAG TPA: glycosyltransferase family 39 protein [Bryobacteraceae bacterium]|nr:glycosyltransferase family 39 protein [Bryobacteraceae bacterium]